LILPPDDCQRYCGADLSGFQRFGPWARYDAAATDLFIADRANEGIVRKIPAIVDRQDEVDPKSKITAQMKRHEGLGICADQVSGPFALPSFLRIAQPPVLGRSAFEERLPWKNAPV